MLQRAVGRAFEVVKVSFLSARRAFVIKSFPGILLLLIRQAGVFSSILLPFLLGNKVKVLHTGKLGQCLTLQERC